MARPEREHELAAASMEAARLHARLGTDFSRPVDIFRIVQELRLWLATEPLGNLFGFYLRSGKAVGIVLNASHPEDLQRYTCAHELGHHILGHESHLDLDTDVRGNTMSLPLKEQAAQVFAGAFLMPLGLVNRVIRSLGLQGAPLSASDVYQISRDTDVSFTAAVWRLRALDRLGARTAQAYAKAGAAAAKATLRGAKAIGPARGDLYLVDNPSDQVKLACRVGDEIRLRLPENRSTGHVWTLSIAPRPQPQHRETLQWDGSSSLTAAPAPVVGGEPSSVLRVVHDDDTAAPTDLDAITAGDAATTEGHTRQVALVAQDEGVQHVTVELRRPWIPDAPAAAAAEVAVTVRPEHLLDGYSQDQMNAHASRLIDAR